MRRTEFFFFEGDNILFNWDLKVVFFIIKFIEDVRCFYFIGFLKW